ncbi:hypothetical protein QUB05_20990 [Microcoleus sp. F10-C6]|uniref:hypothetical protein n=1 Tax=unclassified Microcoleus TaxID=2642155 RepID=UPI002FD18EB0
MATPKSVNKNISGKDLQPTKEEPSLLFAIQELLGGQIDFDEWFQEWKTGFFPRATVVPGDKQSDWTIPKILEITPVNSKSGCRTFKYFRDRDEPENGVIISGTPSMLVQQIVQIDHQQAASGKGFKPNSYENSVKGYPILHLYFREKKKLTLPDRIIEGQLTFRLINEKDTSLTEANLNQLAKSIHSNLSGFVWRKGKKVLSYNAPEQGFKRTWYLVNNEENGKQLLNKLLAIAKQPLLPGKLRLSKALNEAIAFPKNKPDIIVLKKKVKQATERPVADVQLVYAELILASLPEPIRLIDKGAIILK